MKQLKRLALMAVAATAFAASATSALAATAPGYGEFDGCAGKNVDPAVTACWVSIVNGGHMKLGTKNTPIVNPMNLSGGLKPNPTTGGDFVQPTLTGNPQPVPGGLVGITGLDWLINLYPGNLLKLNARAQLAGTPSNPIQDPLMLPLKVKLENPLLLGNCYIGSNSNPIRLNLTRNTTNPPPPNTPISGTSPHGEGDPNLPGVVRLNDGVLVDNAFAVPAAQGCGLLGFGLINALVNLQAGLPSPAGRNEAVQQVDAAIAPVEAVYPPAGFEQ